MLFLRLIVGSILIGFWLVCSDFEQTIASQLADTPKLYPANGAKLVNPDVKLKLTFTEPPKVGTSGKIRIIDAETGKIADELDMSIPAGPVRPVDPTIRAKGYITAPYRYERKQRPTNRDTKPGTPSGGATSRSSDFQLTIIGGFTDGFHFYPITVDGNTATIHPHHDMLESGKRYFVEIDPGVLTTTDGFDGIRRGSWSFETKYWSHTPRPEARDLTVAADGTGDFDTVQGAMDFVPDNGKKRVTVKVKNGVYEELVYFRNKANVTLIGESREKTIVRYANSEVFNPHPANIRTNEAEGTFPSRRAAFTADNSNDIHIVNMTIQTTRTGQAEGLLITGDRNILSNVSIIGSGDALQANGRVYMVDSSIDGHGDTILGRGTLYCERCTIRSTQVFMWPRNKQGVHGNVFKDSTFISVGGSYTIARAPKNGDSTYPFAEVVLLNTTMENISSAGWSTADLGGNVRFWEFNSKDKNGKPIDVSQRVAWSRQLDRVKDAKVIANYSRPEFVLGGWKPKLSIPAK